MRKDMAKENIKSKGQIRLSNLLKPGKKLCIWNTLKRVHRKGDTDEISKIKDNIDIYSHQLSKHRHEITTCDEVKERAEAIRAKLQRVYDDNYRGTEMIYKPKARDER